MLRKSITIFAFCAIMLSTVSAFAALRPNPYARNQQSPVQSTTDTTQSNLQAQNNDQNLQLLFIQTAREAVITRNSQNPNQYILILRNVDPEVAYMSDSPNRSTGKTTMQNFLGELRKVQNSQTDVQQTIPNASLVVNFTAAPTTRGETSGQSNMISLSNPRYDAAKRSMSYDIQRGPNTDVISEGIHQEPVLFIDTNCLYICK